MKTQRLTTEENQQFYRTMVTIAAPIAIQSLIGTSLNMVDTMMIGSLGAESIAAVGIANRIFFLFILFVFGGFSGMSIFTSQFWGQKDLKNIHRVQGIMLSFGFLVSGLFMILALVFPKQIMQIFIDDPEVVRLGVSYMRIIAWSYPLTAMTFAYSYASRSVHRTKLPMVASMVALSLNTFLNYCLIYGNLGFPKWGVAGAATATVVSRTIEMAILIGVIYLGKGHPLAASRKEMRDYDMDMVKRVIKTSAPVFVNEATWALGVTVYYIAYGFLGTEAVAVVQICYVVSDFFQSLFMGIGNAAAVMIGNQIGAAKESLAYEYGVKFLRMSFILSILIGAALYLSRGEIVQFYSLDMETKASLMKALAVVAAFQLPKMFTFVMIVGVLRSGGDTRYCMILDLVGVWAIGVPLAFISTLVWHLPVHWVLVCVFFEEILKGFVTIPRFLSKRWVNNVIRDGFE
ncbi:MATE family efflux transporter [Gottschalkiaceae bacterium SANA]|nr:MATE family efflux transporter [Gottschalkiaceae bacterium SANA]